MKHNLRQLIKKIYLRILDILLSLPIKSKPVFIVGNELHYVIFQNVFPYLKNFEIFALNQEVKDFLKKKGIKYNQAIFFNHVLIAADFIQHEPFYYQMPWYLRCLFSSNRVKKVQMYHGVLDKHWTYSKKKNDLYDLLLVPGKYAAERLINEGISAHKIKIVGFPKFDSLNRKTQKKSRLKKTILYAPTWGAISSLPLALKHLVTLSKTYNVIVKPHYYTEWYYLKFLKKFNLKLAKNPDITSYFMDSDLLISDSSSAMFEYLITGKPIILLDNMLWLEGDESLNSKKGPEYLFRNIFQRVSVDNIAKLPEIVGGALKRKLTQKERVSIFNFLFEPIYPAGKKVADELRIFMS